MATIEDLEEGIRRADAAGDAESVRALGGALLRMREQQKPSAGPDMAGRVAEITREGFTPEQRKAAAEVPPERRIEKPGLVQAGLQAAAAVPVMGGAARGAQLMTRGLPRVSPYTSKLSEMLMPQTGRQLVGRGAFSGAGGGAAQFVSNELPEDTSPLARFGAETAAGAAVEGLAGGVRTLGQALRPLFPGGAERAAKRVVRRFEPDSGPVMPDEVFEGLPQVTATRSETQRQMQQQLRGKRPDEPVDLGVMPQQLREEALGIRRRGEGLAAGLEASRARRLEGITSPRTATEVGEEARNIVNARLSQLKELRDRQVKADYEAAFGAARQRELAGERVNQTEAFKRAEAELKGMRIDPETKLPLKTADTGSQIDMVRREMTGVTMDPVTGEVRRTGVSFAKLEDLRRKLGDAAAGNPEEGFAAIGQQQAGRLKALVEDVMKEFAGGTLDPATGRVAGGAFDQYLRRYQAASEPINKFQTALGQKLVGTSERIRGDFVADPQSLPAQIFSSPTNVRAFVELAGGDKKAVEGLARSFMTERLSGKSPQQIQEFMRLNRGWLAEFPALRSDFETYARKAQQLSGVQTRLAERTKTRAERLDMPTDLGAQVDRFRGIVKSGTLADLRAVSSVMNRTPEGKEAFKTAMSDVIGTEPIGSLQKSMRDRFIPAMKASGMYTDSQIASVNDAVQGIINVQVALNRAAERVARIQRTPGAESNEAQLTRLIGQELSQVRQGGALAAAIAAAAAVGANRIFDVTPGTLGTIGAGGAIVGAGLKSSFTDYGANIRKAVSDIVTDPVKLQQVMSAPRAQQEAIMQRLIRQALTTQAGVDTPERIEEDATR